LFVCLFVCLFELIYKWFNKIWCIRWRHFLSRRVKSLSCNSRRRRSHPMSFFMYQWTTDGHVVPGRHEVDHWLYQIYLVRWQFSHYHQHNSDRWRHLHLSHDRWHDCEGSTDCWSAEDTWQCSSPSLRNYCSYRGRWNISQSVSNQINIE